MGGGIRRREGRREGRRGGVQAWGGRSSSAEVRSWPWNLVYVGMVGMLGQAKGGSETGDETISRGRAPGSVVFEMLPGDSVHILGWEPPA